MSLAVPVLMISHSSILCIFTFYTAPHSNCSVDNTITNVNLPTSLSIEFHSTGFHEANICWTIFRKTITSNFIKI